MSQTLTVQAMQRLDQYSNALAKAYGIPVNALAKQFTGRKKDGRFNGKIGVAGNTYELTETDSCASLDWATLCVWAN
ncbi:major capsid protein, partial [Aeromonas veronii]